MKQKTITALILSLFFLIMISSGCLDFISDGTTTYEAHATKISFAISYGYRVTGSGTGNYGITYNCDKPEVLLGTVTITDLLYEHEYNDTNVADNPVIRWNITGSNSNSYELGIIANVTVESFVVADLNGANALSSSDVQTLHQGLVDQYCQPQSNGTMTFIDPNDPDIKENATTLLNNANTNNTFIVAKELFIWLKQQTTYQVHPGDNNVQPACVTLRAKTGDCDDLSYLYISLCRTVGIPARFIRGYLVEGDDGTGSAVSHAWVEVFVGGNIGNGGWIPVECACSAKNLELQVNQNFGVEDASHLRLFVDDGSNNSINASLSGISLLKYNDMSIDLDDFAEIDNYNVLESKNLVVDKNGYRTYK